MENRLSKFEIVLTVIIFILTCCGIGLTVSNRVEKGQGDLTMENYTEYMQVNCAFNGCIGGGDTMWYTYYITVKPTKYYQLDNVKINYSLKSDGADLPDGTLTVNIKEGESFSQEFRDKFTVTLNGVLGMWNEPTLEIIVNSVEGTYKFSA